MCHAPNDGSTMKKKYVNNNRSVKIQQIEISRYSVIGPNHALYFFLRIILHTSTDTIYIYNAHCFLPTTYAYMC